jgi:hypothetical protein
MIAGVTNGVEWVVILTDLKICGGVLSSLRSRRYLGGRARLGKARGGGMRRREKESEEKWERRERNSAYRKAICFLISAQVPPIKKQPISDETQLIVFPVTDPASQHYA